MPLYEYRCLGCSAHFEKLVPRWGEPVDCPTCSSPEVEKQLSTFAVASAAATASSFEGCGAGACGAPACGTGACSVN
jgi:putative FmdB family regulatory protein